MGGGPRARRDLLILFSLPFVVLKWLSSMGWMVWLYHTWAFG